MTIDDDSKPKRSRATKPTAPTPAQAPAPDQETPAPAKRARTAKAKVTEPAATAGNEGAPAIDRGALEALVRAEHADPFAVLGPHAAGDGLWDVSVFMPGADGVGIVHGGATFPARRVHEAGVFVARLTGRDRPDYRLEVTFGEHVWRGDDAYRFGAFLDAGDVRAVREVGSDAVYRKLGAHRIERDGISGYLFAVWAPNARRVSVVGDFNGWDGRRHPMRLRFDGGIWELFIPDLAPGGRYKYEIKGADQRLVLKADPVAFATERPPATASVLCGLPAPAERDEAWLAERNAGDARRKPISIYECHLGSWARIPEEGDRYLTYRELGERLIPYVKELGFTHIELLPITEYPFDGSWGYQTVSMFAPTSRFGTVEDFKAFVAAAHAAGIGILLDWVPGHFPNDPHGLSLFDGTHLYEHADPRQGYHQDWGTYIYNFGRDEVAAFLVASARFWLEHYGLDGLRVDAVASMLYLDYSRKQGEWVPNRYGGNENLEAIQFMRRMNEVAYGVAPGAVTIAEESTAWPAVSHPTYTGGLGFGFKWNMGWMHDTLRFMSKETIHRRWHHHDLTFGLLYAFTENFVLPLSHDEVVHGKGSLLNKMPGDRWQKFANLRAYLAFMWGHPGKKLIFMGGEFGQEREWNHDVSLDWHLLRDPSHAGLQALVRDLNAAYRDVPALHERDCEASGFDWIVSDDNDNSVIAWLRRGESEGSYAVVVSNFTPIPREAYRIGVPHGGFWRERINSDAAGYGGSNLGNMGGVYAEDTASHGLPSSLTLTLPPLATLIFTPGM